MKSLGLGSSSFSTSNVSLDYTISKKEKSSNSNYLFLRNRHSRVSLTLEFKAPKYPRVEVIKVLAYYVPLDYTILKKEKILNSDSWFLRNYNNRVNLTLICMFMSP